MLYNDRLPFLYDREDPEFMTTDYVLDRLVSMATHGLAMCCAVAYCEYIFRTYMAR